MTCGHKNPGLKIGFTERGDGGLDTSWFERRSSFDGIVVITKNVTAPCAERLLTCVHENYPIMLHATCTGWGGTVIEPRVPTAEIQMASVAKIIKNGFPGNRTVLRIDPVIPTKEGLERFRHVLRLARFYGLLPGLRVRMSVMDEYRHVKTRFAARGLRPAYPDGAFQASTEQFLAVANIMRENADITFETCAETAFENVRNSVRTGCSSTADLTAMGLSANQGTCPLNPQGRNGCLCLPWKREVFAVRRPCAHGCAYCYWKD